MHTNKKHEELDNMYAGDGVKIQHKSHKTNVVLYGSLSKLQGRYLEGGWGW